MAIRLENGHVIKYTEIGNSKTLKNIYMMKAYIYLEFSRTTSFVTVRQLEQEKGVQDSN